jgi:hypothetical protein
LLGARGFACSISSATRTARKLMHESYDVRHS